MERFIARENIRRFKAQLADCSDGERSATLQKLLADEEAHLAQLEGQIPAVPQEVAGPARADAWGPVRGVTGNS